MHSRATHAPKGGRSAAGTQEREKQRHNLLELRGPSDVTSCRIARSCSSRLSRAVILGPNGVGKTMILRNLAHRALHDGRSVVVRTASDLLADLAKQESSVARTRRLEAYVRPHLLCIDEVGYLSYDVRHADLLFEVVTRRHEKKRSIVLTTNKAFAEWPTTFPNAACVVALVDRLINRADIVVIDGDSYRLREAEERQRARATARKRGKDKPAS